MSEPFGIPSFSEAEIDLEKRRIALLDKILADNGALSVEHLFAVVRMKDASLFATFPALKGFIQTRTNLFKVDQAVSTKIENRSVDYRAAMQFIVEKLANSNQQRKINYISAELGQHFPTVKRCDIGSGDTAAYKFVSEHKSILTFAGPTTLKADQRLVSLHPISRTIPSIWIKETLPEYDTSMCRYDRSITINASARVVNAAKATNYLKLEIFSPPYTNETVYVLGKNVGSGDLVNRFPLKSLVKIEAFRAYFAAQPWTATSIEDAAGEESAHLAQTHSGQQKTLIAEDSNNQTNKLASHTWTGSTPSLATTKPTLTIQSEKDEQNTIDIIDGTIGREVVLIRSLWSKLQQKQGGLLALKNQAELEHFLSSRPHLYFVNVDSVSQRSNLHRQVLLRVIAEMKSGTKFTLNSLGARVGSYSAEFKRDVYGSGNAWIQKLVEDHRTLLQIVGPFDPTKPNGQTVQLRNIPLVPARVSSTTGLSSTTTISPSQQAFIPDPNAEKIHGYGIVKKYNKMYGYLTIEGGQYAGNTVYFTAAEIKQDCGSISEILAGLQLNFEAVNCKGMAHPWRALRLSLAVDKATPSSVSSDGEGGVSQVEQPQKLPSSVAVQDAAKESTLKKQKSVAVERPSRSFAVQMETTRKAMVDNFLEYNALSVDLLFEKFALASSSQREFFSYHYQMVEFLCIRSHLYFVEFSTKSVSRRPKDYRRAMSKFLMRCEEDEDCSVEGLRQMALVCTDDTFASVVERCCSKLDFENLLKEHEQLFEMTEVIDNKENRLVRARGTYDFDHDLFLPRCYF